MICSFCVDDKPDVVEGPLGCICPDCVDLCAAVIERRKNPRPDHPGVAELKDAINNALVASLEMKKD